jgi:hypothetical protein
MTESQAPKLTAQENIRELLLQFTERNEKGQLANLAIAFTSVNGAADVLSSRMSPVSMCHLLKLFERRVNASYDKALKGADQPRQPVSPTGPMRTNSPKADGKLTGLPRNVRRQVKRAQEKEAKAKQVRDAKAKQAASTIAAPSKPQ